MDVDISDILADISRPTPISQAPTPSYSTYQYDPATATADHILLTRAWTTERCTPSLSPYPTNLIDRVMDRIRNQIARIEDLASGTYDPSAYTAGGASGSLGQVPKSGSQNLNLTLSILQTDLGRTQFLMRSYLRSRLSKITKYATYYTKYHTGIAGQQEVDSKSSILSQPEIQFLQHHTLLLTNLYNSSFLLSLPPGLRRLDDSTGGSARMDEGPDTSAGVLVRCLKDEWSNEREVFENEESGGDGVGGVQRDEEEKASVELRCERGGVLVARWRDVRAGVERGDLEIL